MPLPSSLPLGQVLLFLLVLTRVSGLLMSAPNFGGTIVPLRVRIFLALAMSLAVTPLAGAAPVEMPGNLIVLGVLLAQEAMLGIAVGLAVTILFSGMQLAGAIATQVAGANLAEVADPSLDTSVTAYGQMLQTIAVLIFFAVGGHRLMIEAVLDSFRWTPPGTGIDADSILAALGEILSQSFILGVRGAAPAMVALLLSVLVMGLISRALPQLNLMAIGFGVQSGVLTAVLGLSLGSIAYLFQDEIAPTIELIADAVSAPLNVVHETLPGDRPPPLSR